MKHSIPYRSKVMNGLLALVFTIGIGVGVAFADSIQCNAGKGGCSAVADPNTGNLIITYNITGLGGTQVADWAVTATVSGHARCKNNGDNCPSAANKFGETDTSVTGQIKVHNGTISGTITVTPKTGLNCPGNQNPVIIDVTWTNITLSVEGVGVFADAGPESASPNTCPA